MKTGNYFCSIKALIARNRVKYYRCDIADSPSSKKKYRVRTTPTIMIFVDGVLETTFKASLDFLCPVELPELKEAIQDAKKSSQF